MRSGLKNMPLSGGGKEPLTAEYAEKKPQSSLRTSFTAAQGFLSQAFL
jgi:hypothetical protein